MEQVPETLWIEHSVFRLYTAPLGLWLRDQPDLEFEQRSAACLRGYIGRWQIDGGSLWLIDLHGWIENRLMRVPDLFDGRTEVPASWYSGEILFEPSPDTIKDGAKAQVQRAHITDGRLNASRAGPV